MVKNTFSDGSAAPLEDRSTQGSRGLALEILASTYGAQQTPRDTSQPAHRSDSTRLNREGVQQEQEVGFDMQQQNDATLTDQTQKMRIINRHLKDQVANIGEQYERLIDMYNHIVSTYVVPYAENYRIRPDPSNFEWANDVLKMILQDVHQAHKWRSHATSLELKIEKLQTDLLAKVEKADARTDDQFRLDFHSLASSVKSLSRNVYAPTETQMLEKFAEPVLLKGVSRQHWNNRVSRKSLLEAWIWSILLHTVFEDPFAFLGQHCDALYNAWTQVFGVLPGQSWPSPTTHSETWRYNTVKNLIGKAGADTIPQGPMLSVSENLSASMVDYRRNVEAVIEVQFNVTDSASNSSMIRQVVDKAFALAMHMALQRSRLQIIFPAVGVAWNSTEMKSMSFDDDEDQDLPNGSVAYVVNPGLVKWGDARGEHFDERYDIVPALVQLDPRASHRPGAIVGGNGHDGQVVIGHHNGDAMMHRNVGTERRRHAETRCEKRAEEDQELA